jgi:hypothetical protein
MAEQIVRQFEGWHEPAPQASAFGEYLLTTGKLQDSALERAERLSDESGDRFEAVITRLSLVSERDLAEALAGFLKLPTATAQDYPDTPVLEERLSRKYLKTAQIIRWVVGDTTSGTGATKQVHVLAKPFEAERRSGGRCADQ